MDNIIKKHSVSADVIKTISMLFIVISHAISYSSIPDGSWADILTKTSIIADNLFVLVTGYLGTGSSYENIKAKKIISLVLKADIYSWIIFTVLLLLKKTTISGETRYDIFPILTGGYWFITVYIILYLIKPFLDRLLCELTKQQQISLCSILILVTSVMPSIPYTLEIGTYHGYSITWFITLYVIGNYLKKYNSITKKKWLVLIAICAYIYKIVLSYVELPFGGILYKINDLNNVIWGLISISVFCLLISINANKYERCFRFFATASLGIFLIHMQPSLKFVLWEWISNPCIIIPIAVVVYVLCALCDKMMVWFVDKIIQLIFQIIEKIIGRKL